ncbi:MAG: type IV secretory system conjugative DNA transfer family protein, partial [Anaerolineaceae bacterium]
ETWDRVILIDPWNLKWVTPFNPLASVEGLSSHRLAQFLTDIVVKVWGVDAMSSPRMVWLLSNTFLALAELKLTLLDLQKFLLDSEFRERNLNHIRNQQILDYFLYEFPKAPSTIHLWVTPVLNKIGGLIFDPEIRQMLAENTSINFRTILDQNMIFLANLPKGIIGEGASSLLAAFLVAHFQKAALSRANVYSRENFYLYLDEFQNYTTDNIKDILSESRKYGLSLILANQYLDQIPVDLRQAVLNTSGTLVSFRVGFQDASRLAKELFSGSDLRTSIEEDFKIIHFGRLPFFSFDQKSESVA